MNWEKYFPLGKMEWTHLADKEIEDLDWKLKYRS